MFGIVKKGYGIITDIEVKFIDKYLFNISIIFHLNAEILFGKHYSLIKSFTFYYQKGLHLKKDNFLNKTGKINYSFVLILKILQLSDTTHTYIQLLCII